MVPVILIGRGRIGGPVADWTLRSGRYRLAAVLGRDAEVVPAAPLAIETAGPGALRRFGPQLLAQGDLWSVGAVALADPGFRAEMAAVAAASGFVLRLFTGWIGGVNLLVAGAAARLHIVQTSPGLAPQPGKVFSGPLAEALERFPDHLNTACAAALAGPGIEATTVELVASAPGGAHGIEARLEGPEGVLTSRIDFAMGGVHPVATAIIAALERRGGWMRYG